MRIGIVFLVAVAATAVLRGAEAAEIQVGGEATWGVPTSDRSFYSTWAKTQNFTVGDVLVFRFTQGAHDVAGVTKEAYDNCNIDNPIFVNRTSPFRFTLDKVEDYYFICNFPNHCLGGQKLAITNVKEASGPSKSPPGAPESPPTSGEGPPQTVTPPPPPPNSASTLASTFTVAFVSIAVSLIFNR